MPIRFYCPFCEQLLSASSRKIGAVVECPACHGKVGVPSPGAPPPLPVLPPTSIAPAAEQPTNDIVITPGQFVALGIAFLILAGLAFTAGLLVGALS
jgi:hypothetical protein